jgi:hypothetical protein
MKEVQLFSYPVFYDYQQNLKLKPTTNFRFCPDTAIINPENISLNNN